MLKTIAFAGLLAALLPALLWAAPAKAPHKTPAKTMAAASMYECSKCHMKFSAAEAKKDHFLDPMDGGKLVAVKTARK